MTGNKSFEQLTQENSHGNGYGAHYINLRLEMMPEIDETVAINGLIDFIDKVIIEKNVFSGHDITILTGGHNYEKFDDERKLYGRSKPVTIRQGVWLASKCIILPGVTIGKHAVIGAGAVVTKDIPAYAVAVGNPANIIKILPH